MDQSARFAQQPAAKFNFKRELPVSESPPDEALAAAEVKVPRYSGLVPPLCSWKEPSLIKYVAPSTYIRVLLLLQEQQQLWNTRAWAVNAPLKANPSC